jgi:NAD(P)-dependent dehydrogenase (short-subunit alcohol dehydrogenase family)
MSTQHGSSPPSDPEGTPPSGATVVTGGARGIGATFSRALATRGDAVVVADLLEAEGRALAAELTGAGLDVRFCPVDVTDRASVDALARFCDTTHGGVANLVNNAAIYQDLGSKTAFTDIDPDTWDRVFAVNVRGAWLATRALYPAMKARGYGRVVTISSATVHAGVAGFPHYVASKAAVIGLTRSLAREVGPHGVTVNAVAPGLVHNESSVGLNGEDYFERADRMRAIPRSMTPQDLVGAVEFLTSSASGFVTGQTIVVDGGGVFA